jgi:hypothetical protein
VNDEIVGGFRRMDKRIDTYPVREAYLWSDGIWRTSPEPIPAVDFKRRASACLSACVGVPTEVLERAAECADHGVIPTLAAKYKADADALLFSAERAYESMIQERNNVPFESRPYTTDETIALLRSAIAKARGIS